MRLRDFPFYYKLHIKWHLGRIPLSIFGLAYTKIGTIQRRLAWPLRKDDTQNREAFHIFLKLRHLYFIKGKRFYYYII